MSVAPFKDNDVEQFGDFVGVQEMNVGEFSNEPDFDDNPFGFFGINFGEFGEAPSLEADPQGGSTEAGLSVTDLSSGGNNLRCRSIMAPGGT